MPITYDPIATANPSGLSTVTFSSIPQTYTDLRIVVSGYTAPSGNPFIQMRINNASGADYNWQVFRNTGSTSIQALASAGQSLIYATDTLLATQPTSPNCSIMDIFQYTSATVGKTILQQVSNSITSTNGIAGFHSWFHNVSSVATTSLVFFPSTGTFSADTTITLYGILRA